MKKFLRSHSKHTYKFFNKNHMAAKKKAAAKKKPAAKKKVAKKSAKKRA